MAAPDRTGATQHAPDLAFAGVNLYSDGHRREARLSDMQGRELQRWQLPFWAAFPDSGRAAEARGRHFWRRVRLLPGGELLDGSLAERVPAFSRGNVLISMLTLDTIAVLDLAHGKLV